MAAVLIGMKHVQVDTQQRVSIAMDISEVKSRITQRKRECCQIGFN